MNVKTKMTVARSRHVVLTRGTWAAERTGSLWPYQVPGHRILVKPCGSDRRRHAFQPRDHLADQITLAKGSSPFDDSACMAEPTRDANCANSSECSLFARFLISQPRIWPDLHAMKALNETTAQQCLRELVAEELSVASLLEITVLAFSRAFNSSDRFWWLSRIPIGVAICLVFTSAAVSSARASLVIIKFAVSVVNCAASRSTPTWKLQDPVY